MLRKIEKTCPHMIRLRAELNIADAICFPCSTGWCSDATVARPGTTTLDPLGTYFALGAVLPIPIPG